MVDKRVDICYKQTMFRLNQHKIAEAAGISGAHLSRILNGKARPGYHVAVKLSSVTGIPFQDWIERPGTEIRSELEQLAVACRLSKD